MGLGKCGQYQRRDKPVSTAQASALALKVDNVTGKELSTNDYTDAEKLALSGHIADQNNPHVTTKTHVGLGNVDNTSDANKPVSTAQATALGLKVDNVDGKGLSANDYTNTDKAEVAKVTDKANTADVLIKTNTTEYTPTADYHPATKQYVDDNAGDPGGIAVQAEEPTDPSVLVWVDTDGAPETLDGSDIALTGYTKPETTSAVAATDTVNSAVGKVERALDDKVNNPLIGKRIAGDGDSIMYGRGNGGVGWIDMLGPMYTMTVDNQSVSGGTIAAETYDGEDPRHWICQTSPTLTQAPIISFSAEASMTTSYNVPLGTLTVGMDDATYPVDDETFYGGLEAYSVKPLRDGMTDNELVLLSRTKSRKSTGLPTLLVLLSIRTAMPS